MGNMNPFRVGFIALAVAGAMLLTDLFWQPVFTLRLTRTVTHPLWILCAVFGALQLYLWYATHSRLTLSDAEVATWGSKLEAATPTIVERARASTPVREIADQVMADHGIPVDVTLRYIIAMGHTDEDA